MRGPKNLTEVFGQDPAKIFAADAVIVFIDILRVTCRLLQ